MSKLGKDKMEAALPSASSSPPPAQPFAVHAPLFGTCIAASGTFPGSNQTIVLADAEALGATISKSIRPGVTHLITSQADCQKASTKVIQANKQGIHLVSLDWLLESKENGAKQPEANFTLTAADYKAVPTASVDSGATSSHKRQISESPEPEPETKRTKLLSSTAEAPAIGKSQIAKDWAVQIPLDDGCPLINYGVYVDDDSVIWDAALNQTNSETNANKFYRLQLLVGPNNHCRTWTRWGRVGDRGQNKILGSGTLEDAMREFKSKFKSKSGLAWEDRMNNPKNNKYTFVERDYEPNEDAGPGGDDEDVETSGQVHKPTPSALDESVQGLMKLIFNERLFAAAMSNMNYDNAKMPLGKLSKASIMRGFSALTDLSAMIQAIGADPNSDGIETTSNLFYSLIPHSFGRARPPVINNLVMVKKEIELLETLVDMKDATAIMRTDTDKLNRLHPLDRQFQGLGLKEMTPLDRDSGEFRVLEMYLNDTRGSTHDAEYEVVDIFRIERDGERERFNQSVFAATEKNQRDRRLLWHGSRVTNFGGILSQGLRIAPPEAPATGYMFGKGVYLADMSSKSANYCMAEVSDDTALLLLCEAELGKPMHERTDAQYDAPERAKEKGSWSTFGKGRVGPSKWKDAACVHPSLRGVTLPATRRSPPGPTDVEDSGLIYNEYICYDEDQVRLRYLFRVNML